MARVGREVFMGKRKAGLPLNKHVAAGDGLLNSTI